MTWDDLAKRILQMPESERTQTVQYREPWEEEDHPDIFAMDIHIALKDLTDVDGVVRIRKGEVFLQ